MFCIIVPRNDCIILNCETVIIASSLIIKLCSIKNLRDQNLDQSNINHWNAISLKSDVTRDFHGRSSKTYKGGLKHIELQNKDIKHYFLNGKLLFSLSMHENCVISTIQNLLCI